METVLIISGAERLAHSKGEFTDSFVNVATNALKDKYNVLTTSIVDGYDVKQEQEKFLQASVVVFQYPVFWFNVPSSLKLYIDTVYESGVFYARGDSYGQGGLLAGKRYLLSTTWNASAEIFGNPSSFYDGKELEDSLISMHKTNQYVGMTPMKSFAAFGVANNPNFEANQANYTAHLRREFGLD